MKIKRFIWLSLFLFAIYGSIFAQTAAQADTASREAVRRLEEALSGGSAGGGTAQVQAARGGQEPAWVNDPYTVYSRERYIAAVGAGADRAEAERRAFAALAAFFGQSVQSEFSAVTAYSQALSRGIITVSENTRVRDEIVTAASLDSLVGAEICNVWDNARGMVFAAARMEKDRTVSIYTDMIRVNQGIIGELTAISAAEKNTFDAYARYKLAAEIAAINAQYGNVVIQAGGSIDSLNLRSAESFNIETRDILRNITVAVVVNGDQANRIQDAFAGIFSGKGLRTRGNNPPYTLEVNAFYREVSFSNNPNKFCEYTLNANLIENSTGASILPFNFTSREGSASYEQAQSRAVLYIERTIRERYPSTLDEYFATLLPQK